MISRSGRSQKIVLDVPASVDKLLGWWLEHIKPLRSEDVHSVVLFGNVTFEEFGSKTQPASHTDCVLLADTAGNFEFVVESEHALGDNITVVGRVVASHVNDDVSAQCVYALNSNLGLGGIAPRA